MVATADLERSTSSKAVVAEAVRSLQEQLREVVKMVVPVVVQRAIPQQPVPQLVEEL
jgi:hypothetical protein